MAERSAALMREFKEGTSDTPAARKGSKGGKGSGESDATSQLTALKSMLGKPHVYGVADRAFKWVGGWALPRIAFVKCGRVSRGEGRAYGMRLSHACVPTAVWASGGKPPARHTFMASSRR